MEGTLEGRCPACGTRIVIRLEGISEARRERYSLTVDGTRPADVRNGDVVRLANHQALDMAAYYVLQNVETLIYNGTHVNTFAEVRDVTPPPSEAVVRPVYVTRLID